MGGVGCRRRIYWRNGDVVARPLKGWWTIALNGLSAFAILLVEVTGYLAGFGWGVLFSVETAMKITLACNIANICLRFVTTTPPGKAADDV